MKPSHMKVVGAVLAGVAFVLNAQIRKQETEEYVDKAVEKRLAEQNQTTSN